MIGRKRRAFARRAVEAERMRLRRTTVDGFYGGLGVMGIDDLMRAVAWYWYDDMQGSRETIRSLAPAAVASRRLRCALWLMGRLSRGDGRPMHGVVPVAAEYASRIREAAVAAREEERRQRCG